MTINQQLLEAGGSLDDLIRTVRDHWWAATHDETGERRGDVHTYVADVFEDHVVVVVGGFREPNRKSYRVGYTVTDGVVMFTDPATWTEVALAYVVAGGDDDLPDEADMAESLRGWITEADGGGDDEMVIMVEGLSANRNRYTADTLKTGVAVFEGAYMYADHPSLTEAQDRPERSIRNRVGRVGKPYLTEVNGKTALKAPFFVSETAGWLKTMIREGLAGEVSIYASGQGKRKDGEFVVESFVPSPHTSVDFVTVASAGGKVVSLAESVPAMAALTAEALEKARPDLVDAIREGGGQSETILLKESSDTMDTIEVLQAEVERLREENTRLFRESRTAAAARLLREALGDDLPEPTRERLTAITAPLVETFASHGSDETEAAFRERVGKLVEAERAYIAKLVPNGGAYAPLVPTGDTTTTDDLVEAFAAILPEAQAKAAAKGR